MLNVKIARLLQGLRSMLPPRELKQACPMPLIALDRGQRPHWSPRSFHAFAREGFAGNVVGYRCIRMICEAAASIPWLLYEGEREHLVHPMLDLLARPNPVQDGQSWLEALYGQLLVTGRGGTAFRARRRYSPSLWV